MKKTVIWAIVVVVVVALGYFFLMNQGEENTSGIPEEMEIAQETSLVGMWQSTEDENFFREFFADGRVVDQYEGIDDATSIGVWTRVTDPSLEPFEFPPVGDAELIKLLFGEEVLYFAVAADTPENELSLVYLNGNGILNFTRVE